MPLGTPAVKGLHSSVNIESFGFLGPGGVNWPLSPDPPYRHGKRLRRYVAAARPRIWHPPEPMPLVAKIVSVGQTRTETAGLDWALEQNIPAAASIRIAV
jgi:hypothetical protein